jgi:hypothetical protein
MECLRVDLPSQDGSLNAKICGDVGVEQTSDTSFEVREDATWTAIIDFHAV